MIIQRYNKVANAYQNNIKDENELIDKVNATLEKTAKTEITTKIDTTSLNKAAHYFDFASYSFLACLIYVICLVLSTFNSELVRKRTIISSFNYKKHNRILLLANTLYSVILWAIYGILSFVLVGDAMQSIHGLIFLLNSFVFVICATCISFFIGSLVTNKDAISGIVNVIALGSSFLCGAFVPSQYLPDFVKTIAHILPTYYYVEANDTLATIENFNMDTLMPIIIDMAIVLGFCVVFVILTNIVSKKKRKIG